MVRTEDVVEPDLRLGITDLVPPRVVEVAFAIDKPPVDGSDIVLLQEREDIEECVAVVSGEIFLTDHRSAETLEHLDVGLDLLWL